MDCFNVAGQELERVLITVSSQLFVSCGCVFFLEASGSSQNPQIFNFCLISAVETLQVLVNDSLGGAVQDGVCAAGPVTLPRRAETFGGFDSHQMNISKSKGECVFPCVCICGSVCIRGSVCLCIHGSV